jgi:hypothetical protein
VEVAQIVGDTVTIASLEQGDRFAQYSTLPVEAFYETFVGFFVAAPFAYLQEGENGGFVNSSVEAYATEYGEYVIDTPNTFLLTVKNYYFHQEFTNSEVVKYTYFNIGNTDIHLEDTSLFTGVQNRIAFHDFTLNGVEYGYQDGEWNANIDISFFDLVYVKKGAYTIFAEIYNKPVTAIYLPYRVYNEDYSGYEYNVYFDETLVYQGEYAHLGEVKTRYGTSRYDAIEYFIDHGGKYHYFGEW